MKRTPKGSSKALEVVVGKPNPAVVGRGVVRSSGETDGRGRRASAPRNRESRPPSPPRVVPTACAAPSPVVAGSAPRGTLARGYPVGRGPPSSGVGARKSGPFVERRPVGLRTVATRPDAGGLRSEPGRDPSVRPGRALGPSEGPRPGTGNRPPGLPQVHTSRRRSTRLGTRTEESNGCASEWAESPNAERK